MAQEALQSILQPSIVQPDEAAYQLFSVTNSMLAFNKNINEISQNAMAGFLHSIRNKEANGVWHIQSRGFSIAFEYKWNLTTGQFSDIQIFKRKS